MKFSVISHACLYIEHSDVRLIIDPWIIGSCYWRSWWNYPKVDEECIKNLRPTHIYISHLHWDHYHGPSLRFLEKFKPKVILPKHFNQRMINDCKNDFNFVDIKEINHGEKLYLGDNFSITSYQFNPFIIDSSLVIEANGITLLNSNDSKVFGLSLNQIIKNHPKFDFVFRSHSSASPLPHCIKGEKPEISDRSPKEYANDFIAFAKATNTKYAIPFASSHIYLHDLTRKFNRFYSNPEYVKNIFEEKINNNQKCIVMSSGSNWSEKNGFNIKANDYSRIKEHTINYLIEVEEKITKQKNKESSLRLNKKGFHTYYKNFLSSIYFPIKLDFRFGFLINEKKTKKLYICIVDGFSKNTYIFELKKEEEVFKYNLSFFIKTPIYVFNDCNLKIMHNTFTPSKLLEIKLISKNSRKNLDNYLMLIDFYENDCLPLKRLLTLRNLKIIIRRWREAIDMLVYIYKIKICRQRIFTLYSKI